jgi:hypothetical protein
MEGICVYSLFRIAAHFYIFFLLTYACGMPVLLGMELGRLLFHSFLLTSVMPMTLKP